MGRRVKIVWGRHNGAPQVDVINANGVSAAENDRVDVRGAGLTEEYGIKVATSATFCPGFRGVGGGAANDQSISLQLVRRQLKDEAIKNRISTYVADLPTSAEGTR